MNRAGAGSWKWVKRVGELRPKPGPGTQYRASGVRMIRIITVEREDGSGGGEIAHQLATRLGWKLWDQSLSEEIAKLANCPQAVVEVREEKTDPLYYRLFKSFLRGSYEGALNAHKLKLVDSECILKFTEQVVQQAAKTGNSVIVGKGAQQFLRSRSDALRV